MNQSAVSLTKTKTEYLNFLKKFRSLQLSTIGKNGRPESSYAPFVVDQNNQFYIYIAHWPVIQKIYFMTQGLESCL